MEQLKEAAVKLMKAINSNDKGAEPDFHFTYLTHNISKEVRITDDASLMYAINNAF